MGWDFQLPEDKILEKKIVATVLYIHVAVMQL